MKVIKLICDYCNKEITTNGYLAFKAKFHPLPTATTVGYPYEIKFDLHLECIKKLGKEFPLFLDRKAYQAYHGGLFKEDF